MLSGVIAGDKVPRAFFNGWRRHHQHKFEEAVVLMQFIHQPGIDIGFARPGLHFNVNIGLIVVTFLNQRISIVIMIGLRVIDTGETRQNRR